MKACFSRSWTSILKPLALGLAICLVTSGCNTLQEKGGASPTPTPTPTAEPEPNTGGGQPEPPQAPADLSPTADAGPDQSVEGGSLVLLDGSGSSDPEGDTLTFSWSQTAGSAVTLSDASSATPSFTAPNSDETLEFELTVADSAGQTATDSMSVSVSKTTQPQLYIANYVGHAITSYADPSTVNGNIAPTTNLSGAQTNLNFPLDIAVNSAGQLLAANVVGPSITTYDDAATANGNIAPSGNVQGAATALAAPYSLAMNEAEDLLFVSDGGVNRVHVFGETTSTTFNGNLAPVRTIASADISVPLGINFGADDDLYVANNGTASIAVFANASNINGTVAATRIITSAVFVNIWDVFVDEFDTMYVVDATGFVYMFFDASTLNGLQAPDMTLDVPPAVFLTSIAVDSQGTGYIIDYVNQAVYSYDEIDTLNGAINPHRTIQGADTQLNFPIRVFLAE